MSIINKTPNIMENARRGALRQLDFANYEAREGDMELAEQHWKAAELLLSFSQDYTPCLEGEL